MLEQFKGFMGELPRVARRNLPNQYAHVASDLRMEDGALSPVKSSTFVTDLVHARETIYLNGASWLAYYIQADVLPGPTATDRLYITQAGQTPRMLANDTYYQLALPAPETAPSAALLQTVGEDVESVLYAITYVTQFGEESQPSPLSNELLWSDGITVRLSNIPTPPTGRGITKLRVYRSQTTTSGLTDLFFVAQINPVSTFDHDLEMYPAQEPIATLDLDVPPDGLRGLISMPNGMMVAHTDREVLFSEPYQPQAWPVKYRLLVDYDIVGLAAFGSQLAVMTKGTPYRGQGTHPETFALERVEELLPCVSSRSIVDLGYAAVYASTDGLVQITTSGAQLISKPIFTASQWDKINPESIFAANSKGRYFFGFDGALPDGGPEKSGLIDLSGDQAFFLRSSITAACLYNDVRTSTLYYQDAGDGKLYVYDDFDAEDSRSMTWVSAPTDLPFPVSFSAIYIEGTDDPSFACEVFADGELKATVTTMNSTERLPSGFKSSHWHIRITGKASISTVALATSLAEIRGLQ